MIHAYLPSDRIQSVVCADSKVALLDVHPLALVDLHSLLHIPDPTAVCR
jgi:hypothetical protein